jgi:hypothetical protein
MYARYASQTRLQPVDLASSRAESAIFLNRAIVDRPSLGRDHADARGHTAILGLNVFNIEIKYGMPNGFGNVRGTSRVGIRKGHHELFATIPGHVVGRSANAQGHALSNGSQHLIARLMAIVVVVRLEPIDVVV